MSTSFSQFVGRLSPGQEEQLVLLVQDLGLVPSGLVTPSIARQWLDEMMQQRFENAMAIEAIDEQMAFCERFCVQNHKRKPIYNDNSVQLLLFD